MTFYDSARQSAQETVQELLNGCEQSIEPLKGDGGHCAVCNAPPDARRVWRKDGTEMARASVCAEHHDTELRVEVSSW